MSFWFIAPIIFAILMLFFIIFLSINDYFESTKRRPPSGQVPVEERCIISKKFLKKKDKGVFYG